MSTKTIYLLVNLALRVTRPLARVRFAAARWQLHYRMEHPEQFPEIYDEDETDDGPDEET